MVEVSWTSCRTHGGPFAHYIWYSKQMSLKDHGAAVWALSISLILVQIPIVALIYTLATLSSRRDANEHERKRAKETSDLIDEQTVEQNRLDLMHVKRSKLTSIASSLSSGGSMMRIDSVDLDRAKEMEMKSLEILERKNQEIAEQQVKVDCLSSRLAAFSNNKTRTEKFVACLTQGEKAKRNRVILVMAMIFLTLLSLPPAILAPFAIMAHLHCDDYTPPHANATSGLWLAYVICNGVPAAVAYAQTLRAAVHWHRPDGCECEDEDPEFGETGLSVREHRAMETWTMRSLSQTLESLSQTVVPERPNRPKATSSSTLASSTGRLARVSEESQEKN